MVALVAILALAWLGLAVVLLGSSLDVGPGQLALPFLSLLAVLLLFGALALFLSMVLPSRRAAASVAGLLLVASYVLSSLASIDESVRGAARLLPLHYYQGAAALEGMNWSWLGWLLGVSALLGLAAWRLFERRDIHVGGEGGWRLPAFAPRR